MLKRNRNLAGIASAISAGIFFSLNDTVIKFLSGDYALHQLVLARSLISLVLVLAVVAPLTGGYAQLVTKRLPTHLLRGAFVVFANMMFFMGLAAMPIAEATAVFFVAPLIITAFSVVFLHERVGPHRWGAVAVGLVGVVVILRPGTAAFQLAALFPVAAAFGYAALHMLTRKLGTTDSAVAMAFYIHITFVVVSALFGLVFGSGRFDNSAGPSLTFITRAWVTYAPDDLFLFLAIGLASTAGGVLISQAYRLCEAGLAAPFEYVAMPLSIFMGWAVFGEWPDQVAWIGIGLILSAGIYLALRESMAGQNLSMRRPNRR